MLLDFGDGRKLERLAGVILDRPSPAADSDVPRHPQLWSQACVRYERESGIEGDWAGLSTLPEPWIFRRGKLALELRPTPFGHVGLFPEQAENWDWIAERVAASARPLKVLNLFAYTGGSTLAAASAGAEVVHIDSAKNVVAWARKNAELSGLAEAPIRWIAEDARKFVQRELRRGNRYDAVILDPPSYGHGPSGQVWRLEDDLPPLLQDCAALLTADADFLLLNCHTEGFGPRELAAALSAVGLANSQIHAAPMALRTEDGRSLPSGTMARWSR